MKLTVTILLQITGKKDSERLPEGLGKTEGGSDVKGDANTTKYLL